MAVSVDTILDLAREARRSPHARRVLFDALIDRYGEDFLFTIVKAQERADRDGVSQMVILRPDHLPAADKELQYERQRHVGYPRMILEAWRVLAILPVDLREIRGRKQKEVSVTLVRPQPPHLRASRLTRLGLG